MWRDRPFSGFRADRGGSSNDPCEVKKENSGMKRTFKMIEPNATAQMDGAPYHEIAIYVRDLLRCDYGLVALLEEDSIRIRGFVGPEGDCYASVGPDLISRLRDWGPGIVDDASLIAGPVSSEGHVLGLLMGYSSKPGTFTTEHLQQLLAYAPVAAN